MKGISSLLPGMLLAAAFAVAPVTHASPSIGALVDDQRCDPMPNGLFQLDELGVRPAFPLNELIGVQIVGPGVFGSCASHPNNFQVPDYQVVITNLTRTSWRNLYFVADTGLVGAGLPTVGNSDGRINGGDAFRIDTVGVNQPLVSESINADRVFEPGEIWIFNVEDWFPGVNLPLTFGSLGVGNASGANANSSASIVAIPEPAGLALLGLGLAGLGLSRRTKS